jgi:hypothetical protein
MTYFIFAILSQNMGIPMKTTEWRCWNGNLVYEILFTVQGLSNPSERGAEVATANTQTPLPSLQEVDSLNGPRYARNTYFVWDNKNEAGTDQALQYSEKSLAFCPRKRHFRTLASEHTTDRNYGILSPPEAENIPFDWSVLYGMSTLLILSDWRVCQNQPRIKFHLTFISQSTQH